LRGHKFTYLLTNSSAMLQTQQNIPQPNILKKMVRLASNWYL